MRIKYRCPVKGSIRLSSLFAVPAGPILYEFETGAHGRLTHVAATVAVPNRDMWPSVQPSTQAGVKLEVNFGSSPYFDIVRKDLRGAEGMLALFGLESIDIENAEEHWLPDTQEEQQELQLFSMKKERAPRPVEDYPPLQFDLVARAFLAASEAGEVETVLSFFRKGSADVREARYIEAVYDFFFMIESVYGGGKFKSRQLEQQYLSSNALQEDVVKSVAEQKASLHVIADDRIRAAFARDYLAKTAPEVTRHIVELRGFLHHHSAQRKDIWHPDDHVPYGADAFFLQVLCMKTAFRLIRPILFAPHHAQRYVELVRSSTAASKG